VRDQRDPTVAGDHQAEPDQAQVGSFLLGLAARGDGRVVVGGVDVGGEVGHVQGQRGDVQPEGSDHGQGDPVLDPGQVLGADGMHGVPELAVVQHRGTDLGEPVRGRGAPPPLEPELGARVDQPAQRGQRQVGAHRRAGVAAPGPDHLVNQRDHAEAIKHPPGGGDVAECEVSGPLGCDRGLLGVERGLDIGGRPEVALGDHLGLAVHPGHLPQVPVRLPADHLLV